MTKEEALNFLPILDAEDLDDCFEEKVFEIKQFVTGRFPITKVINGRLRKLNLLNEAYIVLGGNFGSFHDLPDTSILSNAVKEVIEEYQNKRNQLKLRLMSSVNGNEIVEIVKGLVRLTRSYAAKWCKEGAASEGVVLSVEPNPMDLLEGLKAFSSQGYSDFDSIDKIPEENVLAREVKRLSLWQKMDSNE